MKRLVAVAIACGFVISPGRLKATEWREALQTPDPEVRSDACLALAEGGEAEIELLVPLLRDDSMLVRHCAAYAISRIGGERAEKVFREGLESADYDLRRISALGLGAAGKSGMMDILGPLLQDQNWEVRWAAAYALGKSRDRRALAWLGPVAEADPYSGKEGDYPVRAAAEQAMMRLSGLIGWETVPERAFARGRAEGKPLLLYFRGGGSGLCSQFEKLVFAEEKVIDLLQRCLCLWLDYGAQPQLFSRYGIIRVPTIVFSSPAGNEEGRTEGVVSPEALLEQILKFLETEKSSAHLRERLRENPRDREAAWQLAQLYMDEGSWEKAKEALGLLIESDPYNSSSLLDNALFARAFIQGKLGDYESSRSGLEDLIRRFPSFGDRAQALYCWGLSALKVRRVEEGKEALQTLAEEYPGSDLAAAAAAVLSRLEGD